jgi:UDP-N-acetylmuramoyl-tripeptide--D-alanyl-D-alanine ligase
MKRNLLHIIDYLKLSDDKVKIVNFINLDFKNTIITGVSTDSRNIQTNNLFVPLIGDNFDGHDYRLMTYEKGSIICLWNDNKPIPNIPGVYLLVNDTLEALQMLALEYRKGLNVTIIAITGSNGKTSTKEYVASVLGQIYNVYKTEGNLNNHIGVPLSLLRIEDNHDFAVIEMGMNHYGEIALLTTICLPDIGVITNIGENHIEYFGSKENVGQAKFELYNSMQCGKLIVNFDDEIIVKLLSNYNGSNRDLIDIIKYGILNKDVDVSADIISTSNSIIKQSNLKFNITYYSRGISREFVLNKLGIHNIYNSLVAIIIGITYNVSLDLIEMGLSKNIPTPMRMEINKIQNSYVINDAYNASPTSMKAAIGLLANINEPYKKVLLLGDMLELGDKAKDYHYEIGEYILQNNINLLIAYGEMAIEYITPFIEQGKLSQAIYFSPNQTDEVIQRITKEIQNGCILLLKGSRKMKLENFLNHIDTKVIEKIAMQAKEGKEG